MVHHAVPRSRMQPPQPLRRLRSPAPWWRSLYWVVLLGLLAIMRVSTQARLSELDSDSRRLDRRILDENMRRGELLRERAQLTSLNRLSQVAAAEGMVAPTAIRVLQLGALPQPRTYWELPEEPVVTAPPGQPSPAPAPPGKP